MFGKTLRLNQNLFKNPNTAFYIFALLFPVMKTP